MHSSLVIIFIKNHYVIIIINNYNNNETKIKSVRFLIRYLLFELEKILKKWILYFKLIPIFKLQIIFR